MQISYPEVRGKIEALAGLTNLEKKVTLFSLSSSILFLSHFVFPGSSVVYSFTFIEKQLERTAKNVCPARCGPFFLSLIFSTFFFPFSLLPSISFLFFISFSFFSFFPFLFLFFLFLFVNVRLDPLTI